MKKLLYLSLFSFFFSMTSMAQCGKKVTWTASKTEYLDSAGAVQKTQEGRIDIETTASHITVHFFTPDGQTEVIEGDLEKLNCNWKEAFKNGKTSGKSLLAKSNGETKNTSITIEGTEGKIAITIELENMNGMKMRLPIESYKVEG